MDSRKRLTGVATRRIVADAARFGRRPAEAATAVFMVAATVAALLFGPLAGFQVVGLWTIVVAAPFALVFAARLRRPADELAAVARDVASALTWDEIADVIESSWCVPVAVGELRNAAEARELAAFGGRSPAPAGGMAAAM